MNDDRLAELQEKYNDRDLLEELAWGIYWNHSGYTSKQDGEFLNWLCFKAYKVLKERPQGGNNDLISREALLKAMEEERQYLLARGLTGAEHILVHHCLPVIDNAPAVEPERPKGKWEHIPDDTNKQRVVYKCSECGRVIDVYYREDLDFSYPFCHCGADMRKGGAE